MEFVGHIVNNYDSYLIKNNNIGFRSHDDQIIFNALKDKSIRQQGSHTIVEFFEIFEKLNTQYKLSMNSDFLSHELIKLQSIMMFKEKINLGVKAMENYYTKFQKLSNVANESTKLKLLFLTAKYVPSVIIIAGRKTALGVIKISRRKELVKFNNQLATMTTK